MKRSAILLAVMGVVFGLTRSVRAYTVVKVDVPGVVKTSVYGINDSGVVVGEYYNSAGIYGGFIYEGSTYTALVAPGSNSLTRAYGVNDSGYVVGEYNDDNYNQHGFFYDGGTYTTVDVPGATDTSARGINDSGVIVGYYWDGDWVEHGFVYDGGTYTTVDVPGALGTSVYGINDSGDIVGYYWNDIGGYSFVYDGSTVSIIEVPGAWATWVRDINDSGVIVGSYGDNGEHGFVYDGSTYTRLEVDIPGAWNTRVFGINDSGDVAGDYMFAGHPHGFIAVGEVPLSAANYDASGTDADPVNTYTGELFKQYSPDINLSGPMPLYSGRYYASGLKQSGVAGSLGDNWRHNFEWSLSVSGTDAAITSDKGRSITFSYNGASWDLTGTLNIPFQFVESGSGYVLYNPGIGLLYTFDSGGKLIKIEDGKGNSHTLTYSGSDLTTVSDGLGRTLTFTYSGGKLSTVSDGTRTVVFAYTGDDLTSYTDAAGNVTTYAYDSGGLMTSKTLPEGNTPYSQVYDSGGKVTSQTEASGNTTTFVYDSVAGTTTMTDALGDAHVHTHTASGELSGSQDQEGQDIVLGSDSSGRRSAITDRSGNTRLSTYDEVSGQLASSTLPDGNTVNFSYTPRVISGITFYDQTTISYPDGTSEEFTYDAAGNKTTHTDQRLNSTLFSYTPNGALLKTTSKLGGSVSYSYHADGTIASRTDPAGHSITFEYDNLKRLSLITYPDGTTRRFTWDNNNRLLTGLDEHGNATTLTHDANGRVSSMTDAKGNVTTYAYDGNDRLINITEPLGNVFSSGYDELGRVKNATDSNGNITRLEYDSRGNIISLIDGEGNAWQRSYNADGFVSTTSDPLGNTVSFTRDSLHRITRRTSPIGNHMDAVYDMMGRIINTTDALGNVTAFAYNANGQVSGITLPDGIEASYTRNPAGQVTTITDGNGNDWNQSYDNMGLVVLATDPLGNTVSLSYDNRNRASVVTFPEAMGTLNLTYDAVGNVTRALYSDGTDLNFIFDANDLMTAANGISQEFDANGNIINSNGIILTHDAGGRITGMTFATDKTISYAYNANDQVTQVTDWTGGVTGFNYDVAGQLIGIIRPNGVNTTHTYNGESRLIDINENKGIDAVSSINLTRDGNGRITGASRNVPQTASASTLTSSSHTYDAASQVSGCTYDNMGRLTSDGANSFVWDIANRLNNYTVEGNTVSATYDASGKRLSRTGAGTTRTFVWNRGLSLSSVSIERQGGSDRKYYVHTPDGRLLYSIDVTSDARSFYHFDEMGNTIFVTNDAGAVIGSYAYTPYGEILASTGGLDNAFTWQGRHGVMDEGNGLYYMRARYYDSKLGRFLTRDPKRGMTPQRANPYQYAMANPLHFVDPRGEEDTADGAGFTDSTADTIIGAANTTTSLVTFYGQVAANKGVVELAKGSEGIRLSGFTDKIKSGLMKEQWEKIGKLEKTSGALDKIGFVGDRIGNVVTVIKVKEASDKARQEGKTSLQSALDIHSAQLDAVIASLKAKLITAAEAEERIRSINAVFDQAIDGAWKTELIDNGVAALTAVKDLAKDWANNLVGGSGDAADGVFSKIGDWGWFVDEN